MSETGTAHQRINEIEAQLDSVLNLLTVLSVAMLIGGTLMFLLWRIVVHG